MNHGRVDLAKLGKSYLRSFLVSDKGTGGSLSTSWANESCVGNTGDLAVKKLSFILKSCLVFEFSIFCL